MVGLVARARWSHPIGGADAGLTLTLDRHREPSRRAAVQVHVNLSGLRPEELERLQHGGDVPALAVTGHNRDQRAPSLAPSPRP